MRFCLQYTAWQHHDHTLFGGQVCGCLLHTHLQSFLLQVNPFLQGVGGVSPYLHLHWQRSGLHSSSWKLQSSGRTTHSHPHCVWFRSIMVLIVFVPTSCTVTCTSLDCSGMHDLTDGCVESHDPPHRLSFTMYGKYLKFGLSIGTRVGRGLQYSLLIWTKWKQENGSYITVSCLSYNFYKIFVLRLLYGYDNYSASKPTYFKRRKNSWIYLSEQAMEEEGSKLIFPAFLFSQILV